MTALHTNEIRDYLARAPKCWRFDGLQMVNTRAARLKWLCSLAQGSLDQRINRRAGIANPWKPFTNPNWSAARRNQRNRLRRAGHRELIYLFG